MYKLEISGHIPYFYFMEKATPLPSKDKPPEIISYYTMRRAIGILGITFPLILLAGSSLFGECREVQLSISAYYHTNMRNTFVGFNCAVALFLFAYVPSLVLFLPNQIMG